MLRGDSKISFFQDLKEQIEKLEERVKNQQQNTQAKNEHENFRKRATSWNKGRSRCRLVSYLEDLHHTFVTGQTLYLNSNRCHVT